MEMVQSRLKKMAAEGKKNQERDKLDSGKKKLNPVFVFQSGYARARHVRTNSRMTDL